MLVPRLGTSDPAPADADYGDEQSALLPQGPSASTERPTAYLFFLHQPTENLGLASSELGLYVGLRTLCFTLGCTQVTAVTAAFLLQATNIITPVLAFLAGDRISHRVWLGTAAVTAGTILIFIDGLHKVQKQEKEAAAWLKILGNLAVLAAAFFNSLRTIRVSAIAPGVF